MEKLPWLHVSLRIIPHRAHIIPYCLRSSRLLIRPGLLSRSSFPSEWRYVKQDNFPSSRVWSQGRILFEIKRHETSGGNFFCRKDLSTLTSSTGHLHNEATDRVTPWILIHDEIDTSVDSRGSRLFFNR